MAAGARPKPGARSLEAPRIKRFRREALVERIRAVLQRIVEPVACVDDVEVVAWLENPAEARLPTDDRALRVVLDVVDPRNPRAELQFRNHANQAGLEMALVELDLVPLP